MAMGNGITRRSLVKAGAAVAAVGAAAGVMGACSSKKTYTDKIDCTIGYWGGSPCELPVYIGFMKGYWAECGINATEMLITSSTKELLAKDDIDVFEVTPDVLTTIQEGLNLKLIDTIHYGCFSGVTKKSSGITCCKDLEGKTVAGKAGKVFYEEAMSLCYREGGDNSKITWNNVSDALKEQALLNGEVDAICGQDQIMQPILERNPDFTHFYYAAEDYKDVLCCFLGLNSNTIEKKPDLANRLCEAWAMCMEYLNKDIKKACTECLDAGYLSYFDEYQDAAIQLAKDYNFGIHGETILRSSVRDRYKQLVEAKVIKTAPTDEKEYETWLDAAVDNAVDYHGTK